MAEWLYEAGIGEARAALVEDGAIVEAAIELDDGSLRVGTVARARLVDKAAGLVRLDGGAEAQLMRPAGVTEGATLSVRVIREAIAEPGRAKPAHAVPTDEAPRAGPDPPPRSPPPPPPPPPPPTPPGATPPPPPGQPRGPVLRPDLRPGLCRGGRR